MQTNIQIIPAILAFNEEDYKKKVDIINKTAEFSSGFVQIDITDGEFVTSKSVGLDIIAKYPIKAKIEAHLMVKNPLIWIDSLNKLGVKRIIVSAESDTAEKSFDKIHELGLEAGFGLNPETSLGSVAPLMDKVDVLLLLSVHPGLGGQKFIEESIDKIKQASGMRNHYIFKIEADGGINSENIEAVVEAGADGIVIGEHLIYGNIQENLEKLKQRIHS
ncbi:MAG: hypothetical protein WCV81_01270 [Microgenomates group bacterium]|jgi:ribulose-phosphate 3-epimerase